jgi:hypothetical protein
LSATPYPSRPDTEISVRSDWTAAIAPAGAQAGAASALVGVAQFVFGTCGSALLGLFRDPSGRVMAIVIALLSLMTLAIGLRTKAPQPQIAAV